MLIRCPTCLSAYDLAPELIAGKRPMVRCAHCRDTWAVVQPDRATKPPSPEAHLGPEIVAEARSARPTTRSSASPSRARRTGPAKRPDGWSAAAVSAAAALGLVFAAMTAIGQRDLAVRMYPPSAGLFEAIGLPVNLRGLALAEMHGTLSPPGSRPVLTLQGRIKNLRSAATIVPMLRIAVRDKAQNELYSWTAPAPKPKLDAGETVVFRSRLAAPPENGQDLMVSFADNAEAPQAHSEPQ